MSSAALGHASRAFTAREKVRLVAEVLAAYVTARRIMNSGQLAEVVTRLRAVNQASTTLGGRAAVRTGLRLGSAVERTLAALPTDSRCLVRSLVLTALLSRRGIASTLVIGVRNESTFAAHAWVEHDGIPLLPAGGFGMGRLVEL